ncbi:MAG TPA: hypothetical protein VII62_03310 [Vicinamibacteria bacterium]
MPSEAEWHRAARGTPDAIGPGRGATSHRPRRTATSTSATRRPCRGLAPRRHERLGRPGAGRQRVGVDDVALRPPSRFRAVARVVPSAQPLQGRR